MLRNDLILALRAGRGVLRRRDHPGLRAAIDWGLRAGDLVAVLPGVVAHRSVASAFDARCRAANLWRPDAVITGAAAARLTFWPKLPAHTIDVAVGGRVRCRRPGYRLSERRVPPELISLAGDLRVTSPALTALDLVEERDGDGIDHALRTRFVTLDLLWAVLELTAHRRGNQKRRWMLVDSRDEPWSGAERKAHRVLRGAGLTGWDTNVEVHCGGCTYYIDVAIRRLKIAVEIDGREFHDTPEAFEADRLRQNRLVLDGWLVLRFTATMVRDDPSGMVAAIEQGIADRQNVVSLSRGALR